MWGNFLIHASELLYACMTVCECHDICRYEVKTDYIAIDM